MTEAKRYFRNECALHEISERAQGIVIEIQHFTGDGKYKHLSLMASAILSYVCPIDDSAFEKARESLGKKAKQRAARGKR